jgi:hypothetical protein
MKHAVRTVAKAGRSSLVITAIALTSCDDVPTGPTPPPSVPSATHVSGKVIDYQTNLGAGSVPIEWTVVVGNVQTGSHQTVSDAQGFYTISLPPADRYTVTVGDTSGVVHVPRSPHLTDFFVNKRDCHVWYGVLLDARTRLPVPGARVRMSHSQREVFSAADGSYLLDLGCGAQNRAMTCTGTTLWSVSHPAYSNASFFGSRAEVLCALGFIRRDDFLLEPRAEATP